MPEVNIGTVDATLEFSDETVSGTQPATAGTEMPGDIERLRALLRPLIIEILEDELGQYTRMRG